MPRVLERVVWASRDRKFLDTVCRSVEAFPRVQGFRV